MVEDKLRWLPIGQAPMDSSPIWARGWDWGKVDGARHYTWAYWDVEGMCWKAAGSEGSTLQYLTDFTPRFMI